MSEVLEPTAQDWAGPKTVEEAQCYHQGFIGGATAYARERGDSTLKTRNEILDKLMTEQAWKTVEAMESAMATADPWPTKDVISKLIEAAELLLHRHDYDGHGYEEIAAAVERAKQIISE